MDKGLWAWRIGIGSIALIIFAGAVFTIGKTLDGDYDCPIVRDNGTEFLFCFSVDWDEYCPSIGCESQTFWCGRPGCQCKEEFMNHG
jgi:hypothetical protein